MSDTPIKALILIVDDDPVMRLVIKKSLEKYPNFRCQEATNGYEAVEVFRTTPPDIILMDGMMPKMDGFAACQEIRRLPLGNSVPILMVTGLDDLNSIQRAYDAGATSFINKPIRQQLLYFHVCHLLRASQAIAKLAISEGRLAQAQKISRLGNWQFNIDKDEYYYSSEVYRIFDIPIEMPDMPRDVLLQRVHPDDKEHVITLMNNVITSNTPQQADYRILMTNGSERVVSEHLEIEYQVTGERLLIGIVQDITARKHAEARIHYLAYTDQLTHLPNRQTAHETLQKALPHAHLRGQNVGLLFLDLDLFRRINETFGHEIGDLLLRKIATRLSDYVNELNDITLARHGGDEFTLIVPDCTPAIIETTAQGLLNCLLEPFKIELQKIELFMTSSIGISMSPADGELPDTLLKNAETAMYRAKQEGRNNYRIYNRAMNSAAYQRLSMENQLRRALDNEEFTLHYQPQIDLKNKTILGLEALLRWKNTEIGQVSPATFIPLAEENGLILPIGDWVLNTACQQAKAWQKQGLPPVRIAVNLSSRQFRQRHLAQIVESALQQSELESQFLELELTEGIVMQNVGSTIETLNQLKEMGTMLSVDDFGTGYSSLSYLIQFPLDALKIDRSFVIDLPNNSQSSAIASAIIAMAHSLNLRVIAEGVEEQPQWDFLYQRHCDEVQGKIFSMPQPAENITDILISQMQTSLH